jgi:hypothetical protein
MEHLGKPDTITFVLKGEKVEIRPKMAGVEKERR